METIVQLVLAAIALGGVVFAAIAGRGKVKAERRAAEAEQRAAEATTDRDLTNARSEIRETSDEALVDDLAAAAARARVRAARRSGGGSGNDPGERAGGP